MSWFNVYMTTATFYGSLRAGFRVGGMDTDVLPGTKLLTIMAGAVYAPCLLPVYILNDINRGYMSKYNLKYSDHGYPEKDTSISDILFK